MERGERSMKASQRGAKLSGALSEINCPFALTAYMRYATLRAACDQSSAARASDIAVRNLVGLRR